MWRRLGAWIIKGVDFFLGVPEQRLRGRADTAVDGKGVRLHSSGPNVKVAKLLETEELGIRESDIYTVDSSQDSVSQTFYTLEGVEGHIQSLRGIGYHNIKVKCYDQVKCYNASTTVVVEEE